MQAVDMHINAIEMARFRNLRTIRTLSAILTVVIFIVSVIQSANSYFGYLQPTWYLSACVAIISAGDVLFEMFLRYRVPLVEGRSAHLAEIRLKLEELYTIAGHVTNMREVSTKIEIDRLWMQVGNHIGQLTFDDSMNVVIARSR